MLVASLLLGLALAMTQQMASAGPVDCDRPPKLPNTLVLELINWIGLNTEYDISQTKVHPPGISFCAIGEIIDYEGEDVLVNPDLRAVYDMPRRHIFLVEPWLGEDPLDQARLLHELVHDVQLLNRSWECVQAPEWEAYKLQEKWLLARGIDPGFDWLFIYFRSRCPRDIHP